MYKSRHSRPLHFDYDLIVIGTGSGGGVAAHLANKAGKKVAVVEAEVMGGECPNYGCVPTKALLQAAEVYKTAQTGSVFGIHTTAHVEYPQVKAWKDAVVRRTGTSEGIAMFEADGIAVVSGYAHFLDPWTISVGSKRFRARHFLIATGTKSVVPPIPGLADSGFMTYRDAINLTKLPKSIFVIGGGAIGCEFAELFTSFGVSVHIADMAPRLLALEDPEVGQFITEQFEKRGVSIHTGVKIMRVEKHGQKRTVFFEKDGRLHQISTEAILLSSGKAPNTDLGLENAGVAYGRGGITVNALMQTSARHIFAAGDVVGPYRFTHTAAYQSRIAAHNMFHRKRLAFADYQAIPRCVFVDPEIACVGATEQQLQDKGIRYQVAQVSIGILGRANTSNVDEGFVKVLADKRGRLLGASIASPRAGEMIHELTLAVRKGLTARTVAETVHAFPTWSEAVRLACQKIRSV